MFPKKLKKKTDKEVNKKILKKKKKKIMQYFSKNIFYIFFYYKSFFLFLIKTPKEMLQKRLLKAIKISLKKKKIKKCQYAHELYRKLFI